MLKVLLPLFLALAPWAGAAPLKVALLAESETLRQTVAQSGVQVVSPAEAEVVVLQSAEARNLSETDRAALMAAAQRGAGLLVVGHAVEDGPWLKPLAGGAWAPSSRRFQSLMMLYPLTDASPITREATAFDLQDETSYDLDLDPQIQVLASAFSPKVTSAKRDNRAPEQLDRANVYDIQPQMWSYEGADHHRALVLLPAAEATLKHASIRTFLLRGLAWAAHRDNLDELCPPGDLATLRYPQGGARPARETIKSFQLMPGFQASVVASEPLINKPIAMQFDGAGRLWIAETPEYPNGRRPLNEVAWKETGVLKPGDYDRPATDRISILESTKGDGVMDKKTVYYSGLELVTGFCLYRDGVLAVHQPDIVFIHGTGAAQKVERLFTGFTPGDTHFVANHLTMGADGWVYVNTGSGADAVSVADAKVKAKLSPGVFRFRPDGSAIEQVGSKGGNAFGLDITSEGEIFCNQATSGNPVQQVVLPEWVLAKGKVGEAGSLESVIKGRKVVREDMPTRVPYMQIDVVGGYSSATASTVYEGGAWPAEWDRTVFTTEPILDIIHCEKLKSAGPMMVGEMTVPDREWLRASDFRFFPVDVEFGPDGAMYVFDFYNPIVAHSDTRGPKHSRAGASVRPDREHYFGRIYRIQSEAAQQLPVLDLAQADATALVQAFTHPNKGVRNTALRLLMERADAATALPALTKMAGEQTFAPARILALWALQRLGQLPEAVLSQAVQAGDENVRKAALLVVEAQGDQSKIDLTSALQDANPRVRLLALRALASSPLTRSAARALLAVLPQLADDWSRSAAVAAASANAGPVLEASFQTAGAPSESLLDLARALATSLAEKKDGSALAQVLVTAVAARPESAPLLRTVLETTGAHVPPLAAPSAEVIAALGTLLSSADLLIQADALPFALAWAPEGRAKSLARQRRQEMLALSADAGQPDGLRAAAVRGFIYSRQEDPQSAVSILALLQTNLHDTLAIDIIGALASTGETSLGRPLIAAWPSLSGPAQGALFDALATRSAWAGALLDALQEHELKPSLFGPARLSKLRLHPDAAIAKRAIQVINEVGAGTNGAKDEVIAKLLPIIESQNGDVAKGQVAFTANCSICHKFNGEGKEVGPLLDGIGVHGTNELLIHILDPSRVVDNEHRTWSIALKDGTFAVGIIARENERAVTLHLPGGISQDVRTADIKARQDTGLSLMPEGFEALGADTLRDILAYLRGKSGKFREINLGNSFTTDTGGGLYQSREAQDDTIKPVRYGVAMAEGVPFALPDPTTTQNGGNVIVLRNGRGNSYASTLPKRVEIPVGFAAGNLHFLSGVAGWGGPAEDSRPAMKVTVEHADGKKQVEELYTGDVFIDYVNGADLPGSKRVDGIVSKHFIRYFSLPVQDASPIKNLVLESYDNGIAPTTLAITADTDAPQPRHKFAAEAPRRPKVEEALPKSGETLPAQPVAGTVRALLIGGGSSHDFEKYFHVADEAILQQAGGVVAAYTSNVEEALALLPQADVVVISANHPSFGEAKFQQALGLFADAGHGLVIVHAGVWHNWAPATGYNQRFVGGGSKSHGRGTFEVYNRQPEHPVMQGVPAEFSIMDEHYRVILDAGVPVQVLAETGLEPETKKPYPAVWTVQDAKARIVGISLGHDDKAHDNPAYRKLLSNAVRWVAGRE